MCTLQRGKADSGCHFLNPTLILMVNRNAGEISKTTEVCTPKAKKSHQQEEKMGVMGDPFLS